MAFTVYLAPGTTVTSRTREFPEADAVNVDEAGHLLVRKDKHTIAAFRPGMWLFVEETSASEKA